MATILLVTIIIFCTTATIAKDADVCHGGTRKFNPGFTVVEENGQFLKVLGPVYAKVDFQGIKTLPMKLSEKLNATFSVQPTKEIYTMFASGTVYYEGQPTIEYDEEEDLCMGSSALCPFRRCVTTKRKFQFDLRDAGLLPGLYTGKLNFFSYDEKYVKFHLAGVEFKIKFVE